jgi:hypothetical protein
MYVEAHMICDNPACGKTTPAEKDKRVAPPENGWLTLWRDQRRAVLDGAILPIESTVVSHLTRVEYDFCSPECLIAALQEAIRLSHVTPRNGG